MSRLLQMHSSRYSIKSIIRTNTTIIRNFASIADSYQYPTPRFPSKLFINNEFINGTSTFPVINPGNNTILTEVQAAGPIEVNKAVAAAQEAFADNSQWRTITARERGNYLFKLADLIDANRSELATIEALNNGKTYQQALTQDIPAAASMFRYWAGWSDKITGRTIPINSQHQCYTVPEPVGICGLIVPWNLPLIAAAAKLGPALTTGNTVILKSAEQTPLTALRLAELIQQAKFPPGVVNILSGDGIQCGSPLVRHPSVNKISFTGSVEVGKLIQQEAGKSIKRITLELGGKNPVIVCDDADLDKCIDIIHNGLFWNKGEACASGSRIYVQESIYSEFVKRSRARIARRTVGHAFNTNNTDGSVVDQGAQVSEEHLNKILNYINLGKSEGAKLEYGGNRINSAGNYLEPTLFTEVTDNMTIFKEEIFGPVMCINRFNSLESVLERANNSEFGLAAGIFSRSIEKQQYLAQRIKAGLVFINCYHVVDVAAPFGGYKQSGLGREGGEYGLLPYLEIKNVVNRIA